MEQQIEKPTHPKKFTRTFTVGKHTFIAPEYGEVILTFHDGQLRYIERRVKEKVVDNG